MVNIANADLLRQVQQEQMWLSGDYGNSCYVVAISTKVNSALWRLQRLGKSGCNAAEMLVVELNRKFGNAVSY